MIEPADAAEPWLSVVMPTFRGERWIDESLGSIADGDTRGIEVLIIDSSPTDATLVRARRFAGRFRLKLFERADLTSWHAKTNFGVAQAAASHVCWLGVDDLWRSSRALRLREWIRAAPDMALHLAPSCIVDERGDALGVWRCPLAADTALAPALVLERLMVQNFIGAPAPVFRRDAYLACGGLDERLWYTADWDLWLKLVSLGPARYHDEVTVAFRIHGDSLTATGTRNLRDFASQMQIVLDRHLSRMTGDVRVVGRVARASIRMNTALAAAYSGNFREIPRAMLGLLRLGPRGMHRYWRDSRIGERLVPRIRARLTGRLGRS